MRCSQWRTPVNSLFLSSPSVVAVTAKQSGDHRRYQRVVASRAEPLFKAAVDPLAVVVDEGPCRGPFGCVADAHAVGVGLAGAWVGEQLVEDVLDLIEDEVAVLFLAPVARLVEVCGSPGGNRHVVQHRPHVHGGP